MLKINEQGGMPKAIGSLLLLFMFLMTFIYISDSEAKPRKKLKTIGNPHFYINEVYSDYFRINPSLVQTLSSKITYEEIPVVLFLSQRAKTSPYILLNWRLRGDSWFDITFRLGLDPNIYYLPIPQGVRVGPPFGKAYGYYNKRKQHIILSNDDITNMVLLRVVSDYFALEPIRVIKWRGTGKGFDKIIIELKKRREKVNVRDKNFSIR